VVIVHLNKAEVEVDSRDDEDIDRNEKEESQTLVIFLTDSRRLTIQGKRGSGTPAKVYKRRMTNQRCANHFWNSANLNGQEQAVTE
jgi:hypothetical protein